MKYDVKRIKDGEIFLGNLDTNQPKKEHLKPLQTLRIEGKAYDIHGEELPENYAPMFIHWTEKEQYESIMKAESERIRKS